MGRYAARPGEDGMTAEEIEKLPPKYILTEDEEAKIPSRDELHRRYIALPRETRAKMDMMEGPSKAFLLGCVFTEDELPTFLKGERIASAMLDDFRKKTNGYAAWNAARDYVWGRCFRRADLQGIFGYPPRHRIGMELF